MSYRPDWIRVSLSPEEWHDGHDEGVRRYVEDRTRRRKPILEGTESESNDVLGALAEKVVCVRYGLEWTGKGPEGKDAEFDCETVNVRSTRRENGGLIFRPRDGRGKKIDHPTVLVVQLHDKGPHDNAWSIRGWSTPREGLVDDFLRKGLGTWPDYWEVPVANLNPPPTRSSRQEKA